MNLAVFAYNFPHRKTQDFLLRLFLEGYAVQSVLACDPVELNVPAPTLRVKPLHGNVVHPATICRSLGVPYHVLPHNSDEAVRLLKDSNTDIAVIAGARILKKPVIQSVRKGIVNFHPGLIPECRGLDALKWAIYRDLSVGVTAHFIDERVDAGRIIFRREIALRKDDSFIDMSLRLEETQVDLLPEVLRAVEGKATDDFPLVPYVGKSNGSMPAELERELPEKLRRRLSAQS